MREDATARRAAPPSQRRPWLLVQLGGLYGLWLREVMRAVRDRGQLIGGVSRPILWVLILGIGLNPYFRGEIYGQATFVVPFTYLQFIFPGVVALNVMFTSVQSAVSVIWDRQFGFMREVLTSPLSRTTILLGKILGGSTVALVHGCLVLILARFADVPLSALGALKAIGLMAILSFAVTSLGVVIANRIRTFEGFGVFSNAVIMPLYFTSSSMFPLDPSLSKDQTYVTYPEWLVTIVTYNPLTYAVDALRGVLIGYHQFPIWMGIGVMVGAASSCSPSRSTTSGEPEAAMPDLRRVASNFGAIGLILGLLLAVTFLPPDNSLKEVRAGGALRACTPATYPPLVTGDAERPGIDVELLRAVAARLRVDLALNVNDAIGRDFNPRNWGLSRAQCQIIAGGVVDSDQTRSFLETSPPHARTGWAVISPQPVGDWKGLNVGVLTMVSGLDRMIVSNIYHGGL